jgi:hypothetical protein
MAFAISAGVMIPWPSTVAAIPVGWTRATAYDGRFVKMIATSGTAPGATGGAVTHDHVFAAHQHTYANHTHSGTWGTSAAHSGGVNANATAVAAPSFIGHTHTSAGAAGAPDFATNNSTPATWDTLAQNPLHVTVVFIKSDGTPAGIPVNGLVWATSVLSGFVAYATLDNRLMKGAATGADGGASGGTDPTTHSHTSAVHSHPINNHTHVVSLNGDGAATSALNTSGADTPFASVAHTHAISASGANSGQTTTDTATETSGTADGSGPWWKMRAIQKTTSTGFTLGMVCLWDGALAAIPPGWLLCDGTTGTPSLSQGRYVRGAVNDGEVASSGGAATHTHAAGTAHSHTITGTHTHAVTAVSGANSGTIGRTFQNQSGGAEDGHTHPSTTYTSPTTSTGTSNTTATTQSPNTTNNPLFTELAYIQLYDQFPDAPTINVPTPGPGVTFFTSIGLDATVSDPDGQNVFATFEYDRNDNIWTVIGTGSTVASGAHSLLTWNIVALATGNTYRVRAKTTDVLAAGPALTSGYTTTGLFAINSYPIERATRRLVSPHLVRQDDPTLKRQASPKLTRRQE